MRVDRDWTSRSRVCQGTVQKVYEIEIFPSGHTLDRCWTCKNCDQGSHFGLLKIKICVWTEIGQSFYIDRPWTKLGFQFWTLTLTILVDKCWTTIGLGHTLDKIWIFPAPLRSRDLMQTLVNTCPALARRLPGACPGDCPAVACHSLGVKRQIDFRSPKPPAVFLSISLFDVLRGKKDMPT